MVNHQLQPLGATIASKFSAALSFVGEVQILCYALKYGGNYPLAQSLGRHVLAPHLLERTSAPHLILCPIPIHPRRLRRRGYNQSLFLARGCALGLKAAGRNAQVMELLVKREHRNSQVHFSQYTRWSNAAGAFALNDQRAPEGALVVLIDDTLTTGASLLAAGELLKQRDPKMQLYLLALAKED
jgi:predicted amidophosphoribosyltransferase